jgi:ectoine hydroxylase-related dioxygenase (phytanoyl-CoA dioxygenase family)
MTEIEAEAGMKCFDALEARDGGKLSDRTNEKCHLLLPSLSALVRHSAVLDAVESILGPNILCWASGFVPKKPGDGSYVSWHQDSTYWSLSSSEVLTAWVALTPSSPESGCMQVVPGTHTKDQLPHRETFAKGNLLSRGQEIAVTVDPGQAVNVCLRPGEMSLHHVRIFHGSSTNRSTHPRIGFAIRYIPTHVQQTNGRTTAMLVRGVDRYNHFEPEAVPQAPFDAQAVASHSHAVDALMSLVYPSAPKEPLRS